MSEAMERVTRLNVELRLPPVDLNALYLDQNSLSPLEV